MKRCIDCVFAHEFYINQGEGSELCCVAKSKTTIDLVYGKTSYLSAPECHKERENQLPDKCGKSGRDYVRKWWKFWRPKQ